ncbi:MAG: hypothetical protein JWM86_1428 [Thermoleophilia bacterium]|nr:hypothetical protein [Thermoleophilia bacterium]
MSVHPTSSKHRLARAAATPARLAVAAETGVRTRELQAARAAIAKLPAADRALLAKLGLRVQLVPTSSLEQGMLGATTVVQGAGGRWTPTTIRVASRIHGRGAESLAEVVQHEIGHAISVLRHQDRSEDAAGRYARRF